MEKRYWIIKVLWEFPFDSWKFNKFMIMDYERLINFAPNNNIAIIIPILKRG